MDAFSSDLAILEKDACNHGNKDGDSSSLKVLKRDKLKMDDKKNETEITLMKTRLKRLVLLSKANKNRVIKFD